MSNRGLWLCLVAIAGCDGGVGGHADKSNPDGAADTDVFDPTVNFQRDVRPLMERDCLECHKPGGIAPIDFTYNAADWADGATPDWVSVAAAAVASGAMPPWPADETCRSLENSRKLSDADKQVYADWATSGFQVGREQDYAPPTNTHALRPDGLRDADMILSSAEGWKPSTENPDEYRCFLLGDTVPEDLYISGVEVVPDDTTVVHHAILYQYLPQQSDDIARLREQDEADPGPGYDCWGNPPADTFAAWAPGQIGEFLPDGIGHYAPQGAQWVLQIHYNTLGHDPATVRADHTAVHIWTYGPDDTPEELRVSIPVPNTDLNIVAGDPAAVEDFNFDLSFISDYTELLGDVPVVGVMGHMHQLGTSLELSLDYADRSECLLRIPDWDFAWQMRYTFPESEWLSVSDAKSIHLTCGYDNSAENQIVVNGTRLEPRDVHWGESTRDEMCLAYVQVQAPTLLVKLLLSSF